ncbi:MAG: helix-turn-helix transcriptional regulator [Cellulosilyticaceae bacterium]
MQPFVTSSKLFRETVLMQLGFSAHLQGHLTLYKDPTHIENGYFLFFERPGYYSFGIADYTVSTPFQIHFDNPETLVRFGTVYQGTTQFKLENQASASFKPSSFFVIEEDIKGTQSWQSGQHFHGAEFLIQQTYFEDILARQFHTNFDFKKFTTNFTYHYLPLEILSILKKLQNLAQHNQLTPLFLESAVLECIAHFIQTIESNPDNDFNKQLYHGKVKIGTNRYLHLTSSDLRAIQKAHHILTENIAAPPTIDHLSELVLLNPQKLKAGFAYYYHLPIGKFITTTRMAHAAHLLRTTDESIAAIGSEVGYPYTSHFIKMFRQTYHCTPLEYRYHAHI